METSEIVVHRAEPQAVTAFLPVMGIAQAVERYNAVLGFTQQIMKAGKDYGTIAGIDKPTLLKPGAEKLCSFFGLSPRFILVDRTEQWTGDEPFFFYFYKCQLWRGDLLIAEADGSCNSRETKYRYRWVNEAPVGVANPVTRGGRISEFDFALDKRETSGKYGKPASYWDHFRAEIEAGRATRVQRDTKAGMRPAWEIDATQYRVPNPDVCDQVNTIQKMAQKRALIAVTLIACNASEYYTQDVEDMDSLHVPVAPAKPAPDPMNQEAERPASMSLPDILATFTAAAPINKACGELCERLAKYIGNERLEAILNSHSITFNGDKTSFSGTRANAKACFSEMWGEYQNALRAESEAEEPQF